jgi:hypothetical protein
MMTTTEARPLARAIEITEDTLVIHVKDGRTLAVPLAWFPRLLDATKAQLVNYEIVGGGEALHWPEVDEDISVPRLFGLSSGL